MKEKKKETTIKTQGGYKLLIFLMTILATAGMAYLKSMDMAHILSVTVMGGLGILAVLFLMSQAEESNTYDYDNEEHPARFFLIYTGCLVLAAACAYLPSEGWPFLAVFVILSLFSNTVIGVASGAVLLVISVFLSGNGPESFILYFICGIAATAFFKGLNEAYRIGVPVVMSILFLITGETACVVLFANETLKWELFLIPGMNVVISIILLLTILKVFSSLVIFRYRDRYLEINDPECPLLVDLKEHSKDAYYQAVHTAYFCDRIAKKLSLDADAAKAGGYYYRIGVLFGESAWDKIEEKLSDYRFPPAALKVLKEMLDKKTPIRKKETAVLFLSDAVVSSILFLFSKKENEKLDYEQVIEAVFKKKLETSALRESSISMEELTLMKKIFKEEKLYYDFLR